MARGRYCSSSFPFLFCFCSLAGDNDDFGQKAEGGSCAEVLSPSLCLLRALSSRHCLQTRRQLVSRAGKVACLLRLELATSFADLKEKSRVEWRRRKG